MTAGPDACRCDACGIECRGRFAGCTEVWARRSATAVADQMAAESADRKVTEAAAAQRLTELGAAIEAQALAVAPRIVEDVVARLQLVKRGRLRRGSQVASGLAVGTLRDELEAVRNDLAAVDRLTPTLDSVAERQAELELRIASLTDAVSSL